MSASITIWVLMMWSNTVWATPHNAFRTEHDCLMELAAIKSDTPTAINGFCVAQTLHPVGWHS